MSKMDRLYGVTMPQKGISQLVAVDLQKAEYGCLNYTNAKRSVKNSPRDCKQDKISKREIFLIKKRSYLQDSL